MVWGNYTKKSSKESVKAMITVTYETDGIGDDWWIL